MLMIEKFLTVLIVKGNSSNIYLCVNLIAAILAVVIWLLRVIGGKDPVHEFFFLVGLLYGFHLFFSSVMKREIVALGAGVKAGEDKYVLRFVWATLGVIWFSLILSKNI